MATNIILKPENGTAELLSANASAENRGKDLVYTSAEQKVGETAGAILVSFRDVAGVICDLVETLSTEMASRRRNEIGKVTISFGISGGANANLKLVGAKADAFLSVQVEMGTKAGQVNP